jgi:hypothetical protein
MSASRVPKETKLRPYKLDEYTQQSYYPHSKISMPLYSVPLKNGAHYTDTTVRGCDV